MPSDFSDVDASAHPEALVGYLDWMAEVLGRHKARLVELLEVPPGDGVLDIGCGAGHDLVTLAARGAAPVGVDLSARMLTASRERLDERLGRRVALVRADGAQLPFACASFAGARIERVLQHAADPARLLVEARRVLRPGGRLVAFEPDWTSIAVDSDDPELTDAVLRGVRLGVRQPRIGLRLRAALVDAGFRDVGCEADLGQATSLERLGWAFRVDRALDRTVAAGLLSPEQAGVWRGEMEQRSASGRFWATLPRVVAWARA